MFIPNTSSGLTFKSLAIRLAFVDASNVQVNGAQRGRHREIY